MAPLSIARRRAFTLLEFVVAATLMLVVLALALDLALRSQQRIDHAGQRARDVPVALAFDRLRLDLRASRAVVTPLATPGLWSRDPLVTSGRLGGDVAYAQVERDLVRYPALSNDPNDQVTVLTGVESFRWRRVEATVRATVEVEVRFREAGPWTARSGAAQHGSGRTRTEHVVVTPRNLAATSW